MAKGGKGKSTDARCNEGSAAIHLRRLWDVWRADPEGGELYTFTIITTNANALLRVIHNRMPVIIDNLGGRTWLDPAVSHPGTLSILLQPLPLS